MKKPELKKPDNEATLSSLVLLLASQFNCLRFQVNPQLTITEAEGDAFSLFNCFPPNLKGLHLASLKTEDKRFRFLSNLASAVKEAYEEGLTDIRTLHESFSLPEGPQEVQWVLMPVLTQSQKLKTLQVLALDMKAKKRQQARAEKMIFMEKIIDTVPHNLFWKDKNSIFLGCNENFAKTAKLASSADIIGKTDYDLPWQKEESLAYIADDSDVMRTGRVKINIEEPQTIKGRKHILLTSKVPIYERDGSIMGVLCIYTDITELKNVEEALRIAIQKAEVANYAKTNFLAKVSHELRTPLNGILGTTQILANKNPSAEIRDYLKDIEFSTTHLLNLVNDILDFSCFEEGQIIIRAEPLKFAELVKSVVASAVKKAKTENTQIVQLLDKKLPEMAIGDAFRVKQILLNLVNNALKFTSEGKITVKATCLGKTKTKVKLRFSVEDKGIGIPEDLQEKIFERFYQVDAGYNRKQDGVGLGLAISQQIAMAMDSKIQVKSEPDKGSLFWFDLELDVLALPENNAYSRLFDGAYEGNASLHDEKFEIEVLVVEDNLLNQKILGNMLTELGCQIEMVADGPKALALAKKKTYDLIFMDIGLPEMDGLAVTRALRKLPLHQHTPIVAITAHAFEDDIRMCREASMNDVLVKPITISGLKSVLSTWGRQL